MKIFIMEAMKFLCIILLLVTACTGFAQLNENDKLIAAVKAFHEALVNKNTIAIDKQTDKALSYGHSNGWVQTKMDLIKDFETGYISYQAIKEDSITITMNGDMANVRFIGDYKAIFKGVASNFKLRVLEVWVKKNKHWLLFARQGIKII